MNKLILVHLIICVKFLKCEWVEIKQVVKKAGKEVSELPTPATVTPDLIIETTTSNSIDQLTTMATITEAKITTLVPEFATKFENEDIKATLESTQLTSGITENYLASEMTTDKANIIDLLNMTRNIEDEKDAIVDDEDYADDEDDEDNYVNSTVTSYNGFIPFMRNVQDSLVKNVGNTIKSKIALLKNLRDNLLYEIQERMSKLWNPTNWEVEARGHQDEEYHMEFPSNEGALVTISFLTFAVYLIKLVLKLIYALKSKSQIYTTTISPTATGIVIGRRKRETVHDEANQILQLIEEYNFH